MENKKVLVTAAAGGVGHLAVKGAILRGAHVIGITSTEEKVAFLKSIGCMRAFNYNDSLFSHQIRTAYPDGIDVIWETIGGDTKAILFDHLAVKGRMVTLGSISDNLSKEKNDGGIIDYHVKVCTSRLKYQFIFS